MDIIDTNILSTFAKVKRLDVLFKALNADRLFISPNVLNELKLASDRGYDFPDEIYPLIDEKRIEIVSLTHDEHLIALNLPDSFGGGELDSLALCLSRRCTFATNERKAVSFCKERGIPYVTLAHILRALWKLEILSRDEVKQLISEIEKKDRVTIILKDEILRD